MKKLLLGIGSFAAAAAPVAAVVACGDDDNTIDTGSINFVVTGDKATATITVSSDKANNQLQIQTLGQAILSNPAIKKATIKYISATDNSVTYTPSEFTAADGTALTAAIMADLMTIGTHEATFAGCFDTPTS